LHNTTLDQYTNSVGKLGFIHGDGLMGLRVSSSENDVQSPLHFWHFQL